MLPQDEKKVTFPYPDILTAAIDDEISFLKKVSEFVDEEGL